MNRERYLQEIDAVNAAGKYHPTWESLSTHPVPDWYREKRLGILPALGRVFCSGVS